MRRQEVPEGHLYELRTNNNGAPAEPERRLIWFFCPALRTVQKGALAFGGSVRFGFRHHEVDVMSRLWRSVHPQRVASGQREVRAVGLQR